MAIVFIFDDPADRADWYFRSGWREAAELQVRLERRHGTDPMWSAFLADHRSWVRSHEEDFKITAEERAAPEKAIAKWKRWWPNPGKMAKLAKDPQRRGFLEFVNDWFYGDLSADSHLSYLGIARRASVLAPDQPYETLDGYRHRSTLSGLSLYVATLSEIVIAAKLAFEARRLRHVWDHIRTYGDAAELLKSRYDAELSRLD